jgi:hypothetical protein
MDEIDLKLAMADVKRDEETTAALYAIAFDVATFFDLPMTDAVKWIRGQTMGKIGDDAAAA